MNKKSTARLFSGLALVAATFTATAVNLAITPTAAHAVVSQPDGKITRSEVLRRAQNWVERAVRYNKTRDAGTLYTDIEGDNKYGPDCSGLVSMAWHITASASVGGLNTTGFLNWSGKTVLSSPHDLRPGDAIVNDGHIELFASWKDPGDHTKGAWTYSLNGGGTVTPDGWQDDWAKGPSQNSHGQIGDESWASIQNYTPIRYKNIVDDLPPTSDLDGDGVGDIFATGTDRLTIWNGTGANSVLTGKGFGTGWAQYSRPVAGDFNGDGKNDLAAVKNDQLYIWNSTGPNSFGTGAPLPGLGWNKFAGTLISPGDLNFDGHADLAGIHDDQLYIWDGTGTGTFVGNPPLPGIGWGAYGHPVGGDFNGDGIGDIAAIKDDRLTIWPGNGARSVGVPATTTGTGWNKFATTLTPAGDLNRDGRDDLAGVANNQLTLWNSTGTLVGTGITLPGTGWTAHLPG
ncbi:VCBS repeat-containing protein [Nonomuraea sp. NPDC050310]|uniref:FG-GAP repeat domain-containing protein n=1 Tax=Nonomuraea sp. NPDC050310 TaxID=3154935 RepID=UPI0033EC0B90